MKDKLSNYLGIVLVVGGALNAYLQTLPAEGTVDWMQAGIAVVAAVIAWLTGKDGNMKKKITN